MKKIIAGILIMLSVSVVHAGEQWTEVTDKAQKRTIFGYIVNIVAHTSYSDCTLKDQGRETVLTQKDGSWVNIEELYNAYATEAKIYKNLNSQSPLIRIAIKDGITWEVLVHTDAAKTNLKKITAVQFYERTETRYTGPVDNPTAYEVPVRDVRVSISCTAN